MISTAPFSARLVSDINKKITLNYNLITGTS
jgi:hypothetical protein